MSKFWTGIVFTLVMSFGLVAQEIKPTKVPFGTTPDGKQVFLYTLKNANGMEAQFINYGAAVVSLKVPDGAGKADNIVLGYDSLADYLNGGNAFGAVLGRYANRIAKGKFTLDRQQYQLTLNDGQNSLNGGLKGFDKVFWNVTEGNVKGKAALMFTYASKDSEEGYPGKLMVRVVYHLTDENELRVRFFAKSDKPTILNLSNQICFNLAGAGNGDILEHVLMIKADKFTPVDSSLIPTGELRDVKETPMDFNTPTSIGSRIAKEDGQLKRAGGYNHNFVLKKESSEIELAAQVYEKSSGRILEVLTDAPGLQFCSGDSFGTRVPGKGGKIYPKHAGFSLEAQHFPDSPNKPDFPPAVLSPGDTYSTTTVYRFSTMRIQH